MKKAFLSLLLVSGLSIVASAQSTQKISLTRTQKTTNIKSASRLKAVTKTSSSSSEAKTNETPEGSTAPGSGMMKRKHKHAAIHKMTENSTK